MRTYVITAINPLTGQREPMSLPMSKLAAINAIKKEIRNNAGGSARVFIEPDIQEYEPSQLTFQFPIK